MHDYAQLLRLIKYQDKEVHSLFRCGSQVYGCATPESDEDFLLVSLRAGAKQDLLFRHQVNVTLHTPASFQAAIDSHSIYALESFFSPKETRLKSGPAFKFKLDKAKLKTRVEETSLSDFKKAEKLFPSDPDAAKRKLYHAIRVVRFAEQISQHHTIVNYGAANQMWAEIRSNPSSDWEDYKGLFRPYEISGKHKILIIL